MITFMQDRWLKYNFLFEELVKRDFKKRYKRTVLGMAWSMLGPLLHILVMSLIFIHVMGHTIPHFVIHVFSGVMVFTFFKDSTGQGMTTLTANSGILTKIKVPKYIFLLSKNVASLINFGLILIIFFLFAAINGVSFHPRFFLLIYPIVTLTLFNIGVGLILSALFVFFKDIQYLYDIFTLLLMWMSAIFYRVEDLGFSVTVERLFLLNPIFAHIHYFRLVVLMGLVPAWHIHVVCGAFALVALGLGSFIYKRYNFRFIYYM